MTDDFSLESDGDIEIDRFVDKVLLDMDDEDFSEPQQIKIIDLLSIDILLKVNRKTEDIKIERFVERVLLDMDDENFSESRQQEILAFLSENIFESERVR